MNTWRLYTITTSAGIAALRLTTSALGYRPSAWGLYGGYPSSQLIYLKTNIGGYFPDVVLREDHEESAQITQHPVQTGANISDHAFDLPARLTLEIGVSDVMQSFYGGQFTSGSSRSVNAYKTLLELKSKRQPITVVTRLKKYTNMLIQRISPIVDFRTNEALRATVSLQQIILAEVAKTTAVSSKSQTTDQTKSGSKQSEKLDEDSTASIRGKSDAGAVALKGGYVSPSDSYGFPVND